LLEKPVDDKSLMGAIRTALRAAGSRSASPE
jgi:hypothetical protein